MSERDPSIRFTTVSLDPQYLERLDELEDRCIDRLNALEEGLALRSERLNALEERLDALEASSRKKTFETCVLCRKRPTDYTGVTCQECREREERLEALMKQDKLDAEERSVDPNRCPK